MQRVSVYLHLPAFKSMTCVCPACGWVSFRRELIVEGSRGWKLPPTRGNTYRIRGRRPGPHSRPSVPGPGGEGLSYLGTLPPAPQH